MRVVIDRTKRELLKLYLHPERYRLNGVALSGEGDVCVRGGDKIEFEIRHPQRGNLVVTVSMSEGAQQRVRRNVREVVNLASGLFGEYRLEQISLTSNYGGVEQLNVEAAVYHIPQGVRLDGCVTAIIDDGQQLYRAIDMLECKLELLGVDLGSSLDAHSLVLCDDGLLRPYRICDITSGEEGDCEALREWLLRQSRHRADKESHLTLKQFKFTDSYDNKESSYMEGALFEDRRFVLMDNDLYGYINGAGEVVIEPQYLYASDFREGRAEVKTEDGYGLINLYGKYIIPPHHRQLSYNESSGVSVALNSDNKWLYIGYNGEPLSPPTLEYPDEDITLEQI